MDKSVITTSWDDGHPLDLKLAELLQKYSLPATFYLPVKNRERASLPGAGIREIARFFDIGGHTFHHVDLTGTGIDAAKSEIVDGKTELEAITGKKISMFSYPFGRYNKQIIQIVKEAGFKGARTIKLQSRRVNDPFKMGTMVNATNYFFTRYPFQTIMAGDSRLLLFIIRKNLSFKSWDRIALETLDFVLAHGGIWHLWGHSWEIELNGDWNRLDNVLKAAGSSACGSAGDILKTDNSQLVALNAYQLPGGRGY